MFCETHRTPRMQKAEAYLQTKTQALKQIGSILTQALRLALSFIPLKTKWATPKFPAIEESLNMYFPHLKSLFEKRERLQWKRPRTVLPLPSANTGLPKSNASLR
ncbi:hypothetical protein SLS55_002644 [Diplodia seriata]|uniref:Uncharacterized protein n=1 Tax=Diplodia seriata TaxID=420778 RepID=A0ABR3CSR2_9PEZI